YEELRSVPQLGEKLSEIKTPAGKRIGNKSDYAYVFEPFGYYVPRAMYRLLSHGIRIEVANAPFYNTDKKRFERGSILIPVSGQEKNADQIELLINDIANKDGIDVYAFNTGLDYEGVSLGSSSFMPVKK